MVAGAGDGAGEPGTVAVRLRVRGRVQGVWYRDSCRREAGRLGVRGWAANREDGTVEVHAEGRRDAVDALASWCAEGPPRARVTGIEARDVPAEGHTGFRAR